MITIRLPHTPIRLRVMVPGGSSELLIDVAHCRQNPEHWFVPAKTSDRFCSDSCRIAFNSKKRERKTPNRRGV